MKWLNVSIYTEKEGIDELCAFLYDYGITGLEIEDSGDFMEFIEENTPHWDYVDDELMKKKNMPTRVKMYISDNESGHKMLNGIKEDILELRERSSGVNFGSLEIVMDVVDEEDWANNWKKYYKPIEIGKKLIIKPTWESIQNSDGKVVVEMDPGMAFGTGTHATTSLCLENLEELTKKDDDVLDLGCGSGILGITALMLGAKKLVGVDIDPNAVNISVQNASVNNISSDKYTFLSGNIITDEILQKELFKDKYDIVVANIVADVIIALTPMVENVLNNGGIFMASGIISMRKDEVEAAFAKNGYEILNVKNNKDWLSYVLTKSIKK